MSAPSPSTPFSAEKVPVLDLDGSHLWYSVPSDAEDLVRRSLARKYGSKRRAAGIILLVAFQDLLQEMPIEDIEPAKALQTAMSIHAYGTRFVYREHLDGRYYVYSFTGFCKSGVTVKMKPPVNVLASCGSTFRKSD